MWCCVVCFPQDYGLDVEAFSELVPGCPKRVLELSASCCQVSVCESLVSHEGPHGDNIKVKMMHSFHGKSAVYSV